VVLPKVPLTRARNSWVEYWLLNCTGYSNRRIADEIGVDSKTVEKKRVELESVAEIPQLDRLEGKDGRVRPRAVPRQPPPPASRACEYSRQPPPDQVDRGDFALARLI
jgi:hypothetical protein